MRKIERELVRIVWMEKGLYMEGNVRKERLRKRGDRRMFQREKERGREREKKGRG